MYHSFISLFVRAGSTKKKGVKRSKGDPKHNMQKEEYKRSNNESTVSNILPVDFAFVSIILCACPHFYLFRIISKLFHTLLLGTWEALNGFRMTKSRALLPGGESAFRRHMDKFYYYQPPQALAQRSGPGVLTMAGP